MCRMLAEHMLTLPASDRTAFWRCVVGNVSATAIRSRNTGEPCATALSLLNGLGCASMGTGPPCSLASAELDISAAGFAVVQLARTCSTTVPVITGQRHRALSTLMGWLQRVGPSLQRHAIDDVGVLECAARESMAAVRIGADDATVIMLVADLQLLAELDPSFCDIARERAAALLPNVVRWFEMAASNDDAVIPARVDSWRRRWSDVVETLVDGGIDAVGPTCSWPACRRADGTLLACSGCKIFRYCSPAHARSDWKHGLHRLQCLALRPVQLDIEPNRSAMWNRLDDKLRAIVEKKKPSA